MWIASSKSWASSGSMVKTFSSRRSSRRPISCLVMPGLILDASASTSSGNVDGAPSAIASASTSTPGAPAGPSTLRIRPSGAAFGSWNASIETTTLSPGSAPFQFSRSTNTSCVIRLSSGTTQPDLPVVENVPTVWGEPRSSTSSTSASRFWSAGRFRFWAASATRTRSPWRAVPMRAPRTKNSVPSSWATNPNPCEVTESTPTASLSELRCWMRPPFWVETLPASFSSSTASRRAW